MLDQIKVQVGQKVNLGHSEIIQAVYEYMIQTHNDSCGCKYCINKLLSTYTGWSNTKFKL